MKYIKAPPFVLMTISFSINECCDKGGCNINNLTSVLNFLECPYNLCSSKHTTVIIVY